MPTATLQPPAPPTPAIRDVVAFAAGRYAADIDPATREVLSWVEYTNADVAAMASNAGVIRRTGQGSPIRPGLVPVVLEHGGPVVGWADNVRDAGGKLLLDYVDLDPDVQRAYDEGRLYGHSATIEPNGEACNFRGTSGPVLKDIAVLTRSHPRVKTLGSTVYAEHARPVVLQYRRVGQPIAFCAPAAVGAGRVVTFAEVTMPDPAAAAATGGAADFKTILLTLLMDAPGGVKNWAKGNAKALGLELPKEFQAPAEEEEISILDAKAKEDHKMPEGMKMSEEAERRLATLEAENKLLRTGLEEQVKARRDDVNQRRETRFADLHRELSGRYGTGPAKDAMDLIRSLVGTADVFAEDGAKTLAGAVTRATKYMSPLHRMDSRDPADNAPPSTATTDEQFAEEIITTPGTSPGAAQFFRTHDLGRKVLGSMVKDRKAKVNANG